jgi:uncharacterized iron-regulated membrane protein
MRYAFAFFVLFAIYLWWMRAPPDRRRRTVGALKKHGWAVVLIVLAVYAMVVVGANGWFPKIL